jgi:hypothetical protein
MLLQSNPGVYTGDITGGIPDPSASMISSFPEPVYSPTTSAIVGTADGLRQMSGALDNRYSTVDTANSAALTPFISHDVQVGSAEMPDLNVMPAHPKAAAKVDKKQYTKNQRLAEIAWLKKVVRMRPGWVDYFEGMNKNLQNPEVVKSWRFAVTFCDVYYKADSQCTVGPLYYNLQMHADNTDRESRF